MDLVAKIVFTDGPLAGQEFCLEGPAGKVNNVLLSIELGYRDPIERVQPTRKDGKVLYMVKYRWTRREGEPLVGSTDKPALWTYAYEPKCEPALC